MPISNDAVLLQREPAPVTTTALPEEAMVLPIKPLLQVIDPPFEMTNMTDPLLLPTVRSFPPEMDPWIVIVPPSKIVAPE